MKQRDKKVFENHNRAMLLAMEWGYKAHERGDNLEKATGEFKKLIK